LTLSSPNNLSALTVGQSATINVGLSNLLPGESLVTLTSSVTFPSAQLGTPSTFTTGPILPLILSDPLDYQTVAAPGQADASFLTFSNLASEQIGSNGLFYSFKFTAL